MYKVLIIMVLLWVQMPLQGQNSFSLLYVANINGTMENCKCGKEPLGGVDRLTTVIEQYRERYPALLVLNGGDYFNSYSFLFLNTAMLQALYLLHFDLFVPGDQEFVEGEQFNTMLRTVLGKAWFLSNAGNSKPEMRTFNFSKQRINVYAYLSPACFSFIPKPDYLVLNTTKPVFPDDERDTFNLIVYHGPLNEAKALVRQCPKLELILLAHEQYPYSDSLDNTTIISAGKDAEFAVLLQIGKSDTKWEISRTRIDLNESVPVHAEMSSLLKRYKQKFNTETK